jgi:hypothetical protein
MKTKNNRNRPESEQKVVEDQGQGQAGNFGSDGDTGTRRGISPDKSSPAVSKEDTRQKEKEKKSGR